MMSALGRESKATDPNENITNKAMHVTAYRSTRARIMAIFQPHVAGKTKQERVYCKQQLMKVTMLITNLEIATLKYKTLPQHWPVQCLLKTCRPSYQTSARSLALQ